MRTECQQVAKDLRLLGDILNMRYTRTADAIAQNRAVANFMGHFIENIMDLCLRYFRELLFRNA